jgi:thiol-disulfide isomerase/thioredoxin
MNPVIALAVLAGLVAVATLLGALWRLRTGTVRDAAGQRFRVESLGADARLGSLATIVQFSTEYCGPCRTAERVLGDLASRRPGVRYIDVDLGEHPHLATDYSVLQTPTILLLDAAGSIRSRIGGVPRVDDVTASLDRIAKENDVVAR